MEIVDCCDTFSIDVKCSFCGMVRPTVVCFTSRLNWGAANGVATCRSCLRDRSHPKDWKHWNRIWYVNGQMKKKQKALQKLDVLIEQYPQKRFFGILSLLIGMRHPHEKILEAVDRLAKGKAPTKSQYKRITSLIRTYRNVRAGFVPKRSYIGTGRATVYYGTGSCGLFKS